MKISIEIKGKKTTIKTTTRTEEMNTVFMKRMTVNDLIEYVNRERLTKK